MEAAAAMHQGEREFYEVTIENKMMMYRLSRKIVDTSEGPKDAKWIFVLSTTKILYIGSKSKGTFQHSSFLAGGATSAAGRLVFANGILKSQEGEIEYVEGDDIEMGDMDGMEDFEGFGDEDGVFGRVGDQLCLDHLEQVEVPGGDSRLVLRRQCPATVEPLVLHPELRHTSTVPGRLELHLDHLRLELAAHLAALQHLRLDHPGRVVARHHAAPHHTRA
ncbi:hypothetical protein ZWY2020_020311 [Hordeum vulgare]|nr:hypothetical protein ZWY2020_020311 [Hordeum vulgare]